MLVALVEYRLAKYRKRRNNILSICIVPLRLFNKFVYIRVCPLFLASIYYWTIGVIRRKRADKMEKQ